MVLKLMNLLCVIHTLALAGALSALMLTHALQCATSRGMMGRFDGAKLAKNRPEGNAQPRVERLRRENEQIREVPGTRTSRPETPSLKSET